MYNCHVRYCQWATEPLGTQDEKVDICTMLVFTHGPHFNGPKRTETARRVALLVASLKILRFIIYPVGGFNFCHGMFWTKQKQKQYNYSQG